MKQQITVEQLKELSQKAKEKLHELWTPEWGDLYTDILSPHNTVSSASASSFEYVHGIRVDLEALKERTRTITYTQPQQEVEQFNLPIYTVGQMIAFLQPRKPLVMTCVHNEEKHSWIVCGREKEELCDALWENIKEVLKHA